MGCASIRPERLRERCIRSAPRCISRWQRGGRDLLAAWERDFGMDFVGWVCGACAVRWGFVGLLPRRAAPCSVTGTGAAGCCTIHTSEASLPAAPCAPLCGARGAAPRSLNASAPAGAKTFLLGGFSFPSAFEMRKEKPRSRPPYGCFCPIGGCPPRINKSAWLLFRVLFFAGGDTPRKKSTRSAPRVP